MCPSLIHVFRIGLKYCNPDIWTNICLTTWVSRSAKQLKIHFSSSCPLSTIGYSKTEINIVFQWMKYPSKSWSIVNQCTFHYCQVIDDQIIFSIFHSFGKSAKPVDWINVFFRGIWKHWWKNWSHGSNLSTKFSRKSRPMRNDANWGTLLEWKTLKKWRGCHTW